MGKKTPDILVEHASLPRAFDIDDRHYVRDCIAKKKKVNPMRRHERIMPTPGHARAPGAIEAKRTIDLKP
jgi:hypothetical protein